MQGSRTNCGRHQPSVSARSASAASASSAASARASRRERLELRLQRVEQRVVEQLLARQRALPADSALSSKAFSSGVMKRSAFFIVCRRW